MWHDGTISFAYLPHWSADFHKYSLPIGRFCRLHPIKKHQQMFYKLKKYSFVFIVFIVYFPLGVDPNCKGGIFTRLFFVNIFILLFSLRIPDYYIKNYDPTRALYWNLSRTSNFAIVYLPFIISLWKLQNGVWEWNSDGRFYTLPFKETLNMVFYFSSNGEE